MKIKSNEKESIDVVINKARVEISKHLKKNGINPDDKLLIFDAVAQTIGNNKEEQCEIFYNEKDYEFIIKNVSVGINWVHAMIINDEGEYIAKSSPHTLIRTPKQLNAFSRELKMIELAQSQKYITFIRLMNCSEDYIIGYKKKKIDVYKISDIGLTIAYTKEKE